METPEKVPEWDIFERLQKLEGLKPTVDDTFILAIFGILLTFIHLATISPSNARKIKDSSISYLKRSGLSRETLEALEQELVTLCEEVES